MVGSQELRRGFARLALLAAGSLALGLAVVGVFLPLLPTTPFVLLAAACFLRSSPRLHAALLSNRRLGPYLEQWRHDRSIPPEAKRRAYALVCLSFAISIALVEQLGLRIGLVALMLALLLFLRRLPVGPRPAPETHRLARPESETPPA